jgi:hypothetical protein
MSVDNRNSGLTNEIPLYNFKFEVWFIVIATRLIVPTFLADIVNSEMYFGRIVTD